jgi:alpha-tubulin suppressor-like RCC1 family protein
LICKMYLIEWRTDKTNSIYFRMVSVTTYKAVFILGFVKANMHGLALNWQCGQGSTDDEMSPCHVATLVGLPVSGVAAGLWHTLCITDSGDVYACGGNQFGQLGVGGDHAEVWLCSLPTRRCRLKLLLALWSGWGFVCSKADLGHICWYA